MHGSQCRECLSYPGNEGVRFLRLEEYLKASFEHSESSAQGQHVVGTTLLLLIFVDLKIVQIFAFGVAGRWQSHCCLREELAIL